MDAATVAAELQHLYSSTIEYVVLLSMVTAVVSYLLARHFTKRLHHIHDAVNRLISGDLDIQLAPKGQDEIDALASSINRLVTNLCTEREEMLLAAITSLVNALEAKDAYTFGHSAEVAQLSVQIAVALGLEEQELFTINIAALLHDVGKIGIPDSVLNKPGALTAEEWQLLQEHPVIGARIIAGIPSLAEIAVIVHSHHERWDGKGYPSQLPGRSIPLAARIIAVADAFQAMTSDRSYRAGRSVEKALEELQRCAGSQFDPLVVEAFLQDHRQNEDLRYHLIAGGLRLAGCLRLISGYDFRSIQGVIVAVGVPLVLLFCA